MKKYIIAVLLFLSSEAIAKITVSFEPETVSLGESAELVFRSDMPFKDIPDISHLQAQLAFSGQNQRTYRENINGRMRSVYELSVNVFPRQEGEISTGILKLNGIDIKPAVLKVGGGLETDKIPVFWTADVNTYDVYPQEIVLYTVKLTDEVGLLNGQISTPVIEGARVVQLNMDKSYQDYKDNRRIRIFERTFAVIPEQSGYLTIPPLELYGAIASQKQDYLGDLFAQGILFDGFPVGQKNIRLETEPIQIRVLEKPTDWMGWWLPSTQVSLTAKDDMPEKISVGDSITRTIHLTALNVTAETLPTLRQTTSDGLKVYPSPDKRETIQTPVGDIQGSLTLSVVFVPTKGGELKLPALEIPWFNTKTGKIEKAVIAEKIIQVQGEEKTIPLNEDTKKEVQKITQKKSEQHVKPLDDKAEASSKTFHFSWVIAFSIMGIIIGAVIGYYFSHKRKRHKHSYYLMEKNTSNDKKKKKPIPDLYPF